MSTAKKDFCLHTFYLVVGLFGCYDLLFNIVLQNYPHPIFALRLINVFLVILTYTKPFR